MTQTVGTSGVSRDELARHFDGELTGAEAHELAAQIEADPELQAELEQLDLVRGLVSASLAVKAEAVPQARFEQMWAEIDRTLERDRRAAAEPEAQISLWERIMAAVAPVRWPLAGAAAAAVVAAFVVGSSPAEDKNQAPVASSKLPQKAPAPQAQTSGEERRPSATPASPPAVDMMAQAPDPVDDMPKPKKVEAEIHGVDFSGHTGRISKTGTVTVLYLEEEAEPQDSERSL